MVALVLLSTLVAAASVALTEERRSRAEAVIAAGLVATALVLVPIYALGLLGRLTRPALALATSTLSLGALAWHARGRDPAEAALALVRRAGALAFLPFEGIALAWRRRSLGVVGAVAVTVLFPYQHVAAYLAPTWKDWDSLWYHEPIVAFTIQNKGFAMIELPTGLQVINGVQRVCEMTQLWFAIWAGRRLVDVANVLYMPMLAAAMFALVRRFTRDVSAGVAWAAALVLVPGFLRLVQSTMVDPESAALLLAAAYWVTHRDLDAKAASYAVLALTLAVGAKIWSIIPVGLLTLVLFARVLRRARELGGRRTAALLGAGTSAIVGMQAVTYLRNWIHFRNPFWPMVQYDNAKLGIHWKGAIPVDPGKGLSFNDPFPIFYSKMLMRPYTATGVHHTWQIDDYGFAWSWIVLPLGALAAAAVTARFAANVVTGRVRRGDDATAAVVLAAVAGVSLYLTPARHIARYHVASLGMLAACVAWMGGRRFARTLVEGPGVFAQLGSIMMLAWAQQKTPWICIYEPAQMLKWMKTPYPRREVEEIGNATIPKMLVSPVIPATGLAREREIKAGDVVGFDNIDFAALLWNNDYSSKVVWLASSDPLGEARARNAKWVYTRSGSTLEQQLAGARDWEIVGPLESEQFGSVWRKKP